MEIYWIASSPCRDEGAELAFAALVERHGSMVLRVCHSILGERHDAEDAFQATFLVLARKAGSIRRQNSVVSWLYGVALRIASCQKAAMVRRRGYERTLAVTAEAYANDQDRGELASVLREELGRLAEKYREPIMLCYFQSMSHEQAAMRLGWPVGTVRSRLARVESNCGAGFAPGGGSVGSRHTESTSGRDGHGRDPAVFN